MNNKKLILFSLCFLMGTMAYTQRLDVDGDPGSTETVIDATVNYTLSSNIIAVRGYSQPSTAVWGTGGYFTGGWYGARGEVPSTTDGSFSSYGLRADNNCIGSGPQYGTFSTVTDAGTGVHYGIYAEASGVSGTRYGVYGVADATAGWALYGQGRTYAGTQLAINTTTPETEQVTVEHTCCFGDSGLRIKNPTAGNGDWTIYADAGSNQNLYFLPADGSPDANIEFGTGNWIPTSDANLKKNIESLGAVLPSLMQVRATKYHMLEQDESKEKTFGFLAQELLEVFPGMVNYIEESGTYGVSYTEMIPVLVQGMQEQQDKIQTLEDRIAQLEELIKD